MKKIVIAVSLVLAGCATMQLTRLPENKTSNDLNVNYQEAYRLITQSLINDCGIPSHTIQPAIYPDIKMATITSESENVVAWSVDIKNQSDTKSTIDFYTSYGAQKKFGERINQHINKKISGCFLDELN